MSRRSSLPGADELFRTTSPAGSPAGPPAAAPAEPPSGAPRSGASTGQERHEGGSSLPALRPVTAEDGDLDPLTAAVAAFDDAPGGRADHDMGEGGARSAVVPVRHGSVRRRPRAVGERRPTGRERHEEKITVYVSAEELMDLEHARLNLRGDHGLAVDRGRIVREALAVVLADLEAKGESSILVRRLTGR